MENKEASKVPFVKVVVVGSSLAVGKTSLIEQFVHGQFTENTFVTVGVDFCQKILDLPQNSLSVKLQIWDTCGQERIMPIVQEYLRNTKAVLVVYDVTNRQTFEDTVKYIEVTRKVCGNQVPIVLVGNKIDLPAYRSVSEEAGKTKAKELGVKFIETSAKSGFNVNKAFEIAVSAIQPMLSSFPSRSPADPIVLGSCRVALVLRKDPPLSVFGERVNLHADNSTRFVMFDTKSGQPFRDKVERFLQTASAILVIYDTTNRSSFNHAAKIVNQIQAKYGPFLPSLFLGIRPCPMTNINQKRKVYESEGRSKAKRNGVFFMEVSRVSDLWVTEAFTLLDSFVKNKPQCCQL